MFTIILMMLGGIALGYICRNRTMGWVKHLITGLIWLLLLVLGLEVGSNARVMDSLLTLGGESLLLAVGATLGSVLLAKALWQWVNRVEKRKNDDATENVEIDASSTLSALKGSVVIVAFFVMGVMLSRFGLVTMHPDANNIGYLALASLMTAVGLSIGSDPNTMKRFATINRRLALLPLLTIAGTLAGSAIVSLVLPHRTLSDCMAVGSGMAYYSLSSIFITEYRGAELGTVALLSNIAREIIALLMAPLLVRWFGRLAAIAAGGATTMDTTLPVITRVSGKEMVVVSIFHGFIVDFSVPFLVTFWCSL